MLSNGSEENGNVRSSCEEDEGTDCSDGDSDMLPHHSITNYDVTLLNVLISI